MRAQTSIQPQELLSSADIVTFEQHEISYVPRFRASRALWRMDAVIGHGGPSNGHFGHGIHSPATLRRSLTNEDSSRALALQDHVLQAIAMGAPLDSALTAACHLIEELDPLITPGILILAADGQHFERALGSRAPSSLLDALCGWPLQSPEHHCPCATAILQNEIVLSPDVANDARWSMTWRQLLAEHGLSAHLSFPIVDPFGTPLGTLFATLADPAVDNGCWNIDVLHIGARLAELAFDREHSARSTRLIEAETDRDHRQRVEATLTQMQRLEALGQLTAGVAHDFNNLLTVVLGNLDYLERHADQWSTRQAQLTRRLSLARLAAEHGAKLIAQLLAFSRRQQLAPEVVDVNKVIGDMRLLLQSTLGNSVELQFGLRSAVWPAHVDATQLELVVLNLAINARDAMPNGGRLELTTANLGNGDAHMPPELAEGDYVVIAISDTGMGMSDEVLAHAFEPFFTTKEIGQGSGLGLAQVYGFAKQSGGDVQIDSRLDEGTTVRLYLPRADHVAGDSVLRPTLPEVSIAGRRILLVDDDAGVRHVTQTLLLEMGCRVDAVGGARAALELLRTDLPIDLLLADFAMPDMNGLELVRVARELRPGLSTLIMTGYANGDALRDFPNSALLLKPFRREQLAARILARIRGEAS